MGTSSKAIRGQLESVASQQEGFFTAKQAVEAGYNDSVHPYHLRTGDWIRMYRGIYRLADRPLPPWPELVTYALWSRDRELNCQGAYSGETALAIHGVLPRCPSPLQMVVPKSFRKNCEIPKKLVLEKRDVDPGDIEEHAGYRVLTLQATLSSMIETTNPEIIKLLDSYRVRERGGKADHRPSFDDMLKMGID